MHAYIITSQNTLLLKRVVHKAALFYLSQAKAPSYVENVRFFMVNTLMHPKNTERHYFNMLTKGVSKVAMLLGLFDESCV